MNYCYADRMEAFGRSPIREVLKLAGDPSVISLAAGNPSPESFPAKDFREILDRLLTEQPAAVLQYGVSEGYAPLQAAIRRRMADKYQSCGEEDGILITSGAQQAIESFAKCFLNEGDGVICENPSFISSLNAIRSYNGGRLFGIPMEEDGMDMDALERTLRTEKNIKFIYTIPTYQNPTGLTMSLEKRMRMLELAKRYHVLILEDSPYFELRYSGECVPTLKSLDKDGIVAFAGSLSKILAPGLRLGFLIASAEVIKRVTKCKQVSDVHTNLLTQAMASEYLTHCDVDGHIRDICHMYRQSRDVMLDALKGLDRRVCCTQPDGGLFLWCKMPEGYWAEELQDRVWAAGKVLLITGPAFSVSPGQFANCFRMNFSMPTHEKIRVGASIVRDCLNAYLRETPKRMEEGR